MASPLLLNSRILVVDDDEVNAALLEQILATAGYLQTLSSTDSNEALRMIMSGWPDLVLLDLHMPDPNGFEILRRARSSGGAAARCPILVFTADATLEAKRKALEAGASDFLTKPGDMIEILLRVHNFLDLRQLQKDLEEANRTLEDRVKERTQELWDANIEIVHRLARAAEYRDDQTGEHIRRVAAFAYRLALELGIPEDQAELIRLAAPLHDVGKIALSDSILLKPAALTPEERRLMERHTTVGANILSEGKSDLLRIAETIALTHHERWDGSGYPKGLAREAIPMPGRILAVADVFDALTHERPYKKAWPVERALAEITRDAGTHFDPDVVRAMQRALERDGLTAVLAPLEFR